MRTGAAKRKSTRCVKTRGAQCKKMRKAHKIREEIGKQVAQRRTRVELGAHGVDQGAHGCDRRAHGGDRGARGVKQGSRGGVHGGGHHAAHGSHCTRRRRKWGQYASATRQGGKVMDDDLRGRRIRRSIAADDYINASEKRALNAAEESPLMRKVERSRKERTGG